MTIFKLLLDSLRFYWRTNLAVLLGVVAGTAVIGGALIVGDSVRGSLRQMTLDRLGPIDHALSGQRFFREALAEEIAASEAFRERFEHVAPAIAMRAAVTRNFEPASAAPGGSPGSAAPMTVAGLREPAALARAGRVNIYGVDERLWRLLDHGDVPLPGDGEVIVSSRLAESLYEATRERDRELAAGDEVTISIELPATIPRDTLLGGDDQEATEFPVRVKAILPDASGAGRLELNPHQQLPANAFVNLAFLQRQLGLDERRVRNRKRQTYIEKPARVNALFVAARHEADGRGDAAAGAAAGLNTLLKDRLQLVDLSLRAVPNETFGYVSLESEQQILARAFSEPARRAAERVQLARSEVLVYLANQTYRYGGQDVDYDRRRGYSMYSAVAGLEFPLEPPFGPFRFEGPTPRFPLARNQVILNEWLAADIGAAPGDRVYMSWHVVGAHGERPESGGTFTVAGIAVLDDTPAADEGLTPEVEGITDAESFSDWERQPFPLRTELITPRDEAYWDERHATPKAFVQLQTAQELWGSRYGDLTSVRVAPRQTDQALADVEREFTRAFLDELNLAEAGLAFQPVKLQGLEAASGTTDFAGLFLAFSFFLILSATILIGLLFRLGMERRAEQLGLLSAVGFPSQRLRRLFLSEGLVVVLAGGLLGLPAAVGYAWLMVYGLRTWWIGAVGTRFLDLYVEPRSLVIGAAIAVAVALAAVWWALRQMRGLSGRELLAGTSERALTERQTAHRGRVMVRWGAAVLIAALIIAGVGLAGRLPTGEAFLGISWQAVGFFVVGLLMLGSALAFLDGWLNADRQGAVRGRGFAGVARLATRNASRNRLRSVLTVGLIASATFVIVAIAAGHRNPAAERPALHSGNGGFLLVGETATPILADLNTREGRRRVGLTFPMNETDERDEWDRKRRLRILIDNVTFLPFRVRPGEDASCLNLYQTALPTILGVPLEPMLTRGGFRFAGAGRENPWTLLGEPLDPVEVDGRRVPVYPAFGDLNTLTWSLHKGRGDLIAVPDESHPEAFLKIVGVLDGSVFQSELLVAEDDFQRLFPEQAGYSYFLVEGDPEVGQELSNLLESALSPYGFDAEPVGERLNRFLAVQNTYLSTFQALGGLGLLLGTLGLGTVMLRNVLERRSELALLRSVGFRRAGLGGLVLSESALVLAWGLLAGAGSALVAMLPHLQTTGADVPWLAVAVILAAVFVVGIAAAGVAVAEAVRTPIVTTLRGE